MSDEKKARKMGAAKKVREYDRCANYAKCGETSANTDLVFVWAMSSSLSHGKMRLLGAKCRA